MNYQRRELLCALGAGVSLGSAGCLSRGDPREGPADGEQEPKQRPQQSADPSPREGAVAEQREEAVTSEETATSEEAAMTAAEVRLAETTDRIMDELAWFATEYASSIEAYRTAGDQVTATVSAVGEEVPLTEGDVRRLDGERDRPRMDRGWPYDVWWEKGAKRWRRTSIDWQDPSQADREPPLLDSGAIESLREAVTTFADTFEEQLHPHFSGAGKERQFGVDTVDVIERFNGMGDAAMVVAGLVRLYEHYEAVTGPTYVQKNLSENPIRNRLTEYLGSPDVHNAPFSPLFELEYRGQANAKAFSHARSAGEGISEGLYRTEPVNSIDGSTRDSGHLRVQDLVENVTVENNRVDTCYCIISALQGGDSLTYTADLPSQSIFVQRYRNATSAVNARRQLFARDGVSRIDGPVIPSGNDGLDWKPIAFQFSGEPWYAIFQRIGRHIITAGVSRRPFQHRNATSGETNWLSLLSSSWLLTVSETSE